ncbi:hypothetical protein FS837_004384 [Tulasnella sp. UAMH 9824]|nr:hypothetical protein FS837_004384 [Tulasnella sp. UAMH 9824]
MPIHERLPNEIFETILQLCVGFETPVRDLSTLPLVCRRWRDIIANASFLWCTISAAEGEQALRKALQMAKNSLLNINFTKNINGTDQSKFFRLVRERVGHWDSLLVQSRRSGAALAVLPTPKPPNLRTLDVIARHNLPPPKGDTVLFGGDPAVGLKNLRLTNVPIQLTSLHLTGLKALHLEGMPFLSATGAMMVISHSPTLEILHLARLKDAALLAEPSTSHPDLVSQPPIQLAFLIKLHISALPLPFLNLLLSILAVPQLRHFNVECNVDERPAARFLAVGIQHILPILRPIAAASQGYEAVLSVWGYYIICIGELTVTMTCSSIEFSMNHFQETYDWPSSHLEIKLDDLPLHLNLHDCNPEPSYLEWFTQRKNTTKLTLYSNPWFGTSLEGIIPFLSRPTSSSPSPKWLLPQMTILVTNLVFDDRKSDIVDMIEKRHSVSPMSSAGVDGPLPTRFKQIWLTYGGRYPPGPPPMDEFLSEVVRVVGGADVYWEGKKTQRR